MNYDDLDKLNDLRQKGAISEAEYNEQKARILNNSCPPSPSEGLPLGLSENNYNAIMNIVQIAFGLGWVISIIMWVIGKENSEKVSVQGKYILNWLISGVIYSAIAGIVALVTFGLGAFLLAPFFIVLGICAILFPIIGGIKSLSGETWQYPLSIRFLK